jgi:hypothetical protein
LNNKTAIINIARKMSTDKKIDRDASIQKLTAEYNALKIELEEAQRTQLFSCTPENKVLSVSTHSTQLFSGSNDHVDNLKREMHQVYKDLRWVRGMKDIEEQEKLKNIIISK